MAITITQYETRTSYTRVKFCLTALAPGSSDFVRFRQISSDFVKCRQISSDRQITSDFVFVRFQQNVRFSSVFCQITSDFNRSSDFVRFVRFRQISSDFVRYRQISSDYVRSSDFVRLRQIPSDSVRLQNCKIVKLQNCKIVKLRNCKIAKL